MTLKIGDRVLVNTRSNLGIVPDTVRSVPFSQIITLQPHAPNQTKQAVLLVHLSWALVEDLLPLPAHWDHAPTPARSPEPEPKRTAFIVHAVTQARAFHRAMLQSRRAGIVSHALLARERRDIWLDAARRAKTGASL